MSNLEKEMFKPRMTQIPTGYVCITIERYEDLIDTEIRNKILLNTLTNVAEKHIRELVKRIYKEGKLDG